MKTAQMEAEETARREFQAHLDGHRCHCGRYKWPGFCFCFSCQDRLPGRERLKLYGKSGDDYRHAYHDVRAWLEETAIEETDNGTENQ